MTIVFDRIVIAVPDLSAAIAQYQQLLGVTPFYHMNAEGETVAWWGLPNTVIELVQRCVDGPCVQGIVFGSEESGEPERVVTNALGLDINVSDRQRTLEFRRQQPQSQLQGLSVDHLVLRTTDAEGCIRLFRDELGVRLALDKTVPEWGGRMLFFRAGKLTLEVIESDSNDAGVSAFWGFAFQCQDLHTLYKELGQRKVSVSDIRKGRKPGTQVATIKSHCLEIPTLLIQPATG
jgi:hypothetical protein